MLILFVLSLLAAVSFAVYVLTPLILITWTKRKQALDLQSQEAFETIYLFFDLASLRSAFSIALGLSYVLVVLLTGSMVTAVMAPLLLMLTWPVLLRLFQRRRQQAICKQLPDFIQALALSSQAGLGLQAAFTQLVSRTPRPLRQELELCLKEQQLGLSLQQSLLHFHERVPHEGTQLLAASLAMVHRSGGRISDVLERLALNLRAQLHLEAKVRALTAQASLQAWVMAAVPLLLAVALTAIQPDLMRPLWTEPSGWGVVAIIIVMEVMGLRLLMNIARITI